MFRKVLELVENFLVHTHVCNGILFESRPKNLEKELYTPKNNIGSPETLVPVAFCLYNGHESSVVPFDARIVSACFPQLLENRKMSNDDKKDYYCIETVFYGDSSETFSHKHIEGYIRFLHKISGKKELFDLTEIMVHQMHAEYALCILSAISVDYYRLINYPCREYVSFLSRAIQGSIDGEEARREDEEKDDSDDEIKRSDIECLEESETDVPRRTIFEEIVEKEAAWNFAGPSQRLDDEWK